MPAFPERRDSGELVAPADPSGIEGGDEQVAQGRPVDLGTAAFAVLRYLFDEDSAAFVEDAHGLTLWVGEAAERLVEAGGAKGMLPGFLMHVEEPALLACIRAG